MNIELGIGIGGGSLFAPTSSDQLVAYAWASALSPSVSTSSVVHTTINAIPANNAVSALSPTVSSAGNAIISSVIANANTNALIPSVAIAGSVSVNAVIASSNSDSIIPVVSTIRNVSVSGVVADSTASVGVPTVTVGGAATYYLQMDGVDDYISIPSLTYKDVVMELEIDSVNDTGRHQYVRYGDAEFFRNNGLDTHDANTFYVDGVQKAQNTIAVPINQRVLFRMVGWVDYTSTGNIFRNPANHSYMMGKIWDIKLYNNAGTLVAHYDMSTGTVLDQTGNGNHATLTGGTWVVA